MPDAIASIVPATTTAGTDQPNVLIIGGALKFVRKARELGLNVTYLQYPNAYERDHWPYVDQALLLNYGDVERVLPLARALHAIQPFQTAISMFELGLLPAAKINEALGLKGETVETVELLLDKWRMRQILADKNISPMASAVGRSAQDVRDFAETHGLPIIIKPVRESGSVGVFYIRDLSEVDEIAAQYRSLDDEGWVMGDLFGEDSFEVFLMEEYLDGPEICIDTLSFDGHHVPIGIADKEELGGTTGFVEVGLAQPSKCPPEVLDEATKMVADFLDAMGLRDGPTHTEFRLTSRGPRIIESHNRVGGVGVNEMTEAAYGIDIERYALAAKFGLAPPLTESPKCSGGSAVRSILTKSGRVEKITGLEAMRADPAFVYLQMNVRPGDEIRPLTWNADMAGYVVARGSDNENATANCKRLVDMINIQTTPIE